MTKGLDVVGCLVLAALGPEFSPLKPRLRVRHTRAEEPRSAVTCLAMPVRHVVCDFHLRVCKKMFWRKDRSCLGTSEGRTGLGPHAQK